ncbi:LysM peptidoglycan-binding domain-containing protein [Lactobacillus crispatus]|nr:LysM domain-containing protein [Lactobacillus crispatus]MCZ3572130.1 LysM peptidoglycan-binding domain-containing protein [Lactobacillus crispatus]MCZ3578142.1 LysM peptidoglycan-binding domain-containing protein [Lactobacillus crispatus]MCZ3597459.1 LysM peptidoglycan-binding domain-containing protein [Lactobacillus crispatus]
MSKKYGSSVQWMARVNHIKNPNLIYPGNKIRVA